MPRVVTAEDLRAGLGRELDALREYSMRTRILGYDG